MSDVDKSNIIITTVEEDENNEPDPTMKAEIEAAVGFLTDFLVKSPKHEFSKESVDLFRRSLQSALYRRYNGHWNTDNPLQGSAFRCLRINGLVEPLIEIAAKASRLPLRKVRQAFPAEVTLWVDPGDVSVRFGEEGSVGVWYASTTASRLSDATTTPQRVQHSQQPQRTPYRSASPTGFFCQQQVQQQPQRTPHRSESPTGFFCQQQQPQRTPYRKASPTMVFVPLQQQQQPPQRTPHRSESPTGFFVPQQPQWTSPQRSSPSSGFMTAMSHQQQQMQRAAVVGRQTPIRYNQLPQTHHSSPSGSWRSSPQPGNEHLSMVSTSPSNVSECGEEQRCKMLAERLMRENLMASIVPGLVSSRVQPVGVGVN